VAAVGERIAWRGTCNRCGLCCVTEHEGQRLTCEFLRARIQLREHGGPSIVMLGQPEASWCGVYDGRVDGMPIRMLDGHGQARLLGRCGLNSAMEDTVILERGVGRGCSLELERATVPVGEFIRHG